MVSFSEDREYHIIPFVFECLHAKLAAIAESENMMEINLKDGQLLEVRDYAW